MYILFDTERLRSVMENLVRNAVESSTEDSKIEINTFADKRTVTVCVLDRGGGISEEIRKHLFDPFFTTKVRGSGIDLSISKRFAEAAGGSIEFVERKGGGTKARLVLKKYYAGLH